MANIPITHAWGGQGLKTPPAPLAAGALAWLATMVAWRTGALDGAAGWYCLAISAPLLVGGALLAVRGAPQHASGRARTLVDGLIVAGSALFVAWSAGLGELYVKADPGAQVLLAQAVGFVAVAACGVVALTRAPAARSILAPLTLGLLAIATASGAYAYLELGGTGGPTWTLLIGWLAGWLLVARTALAADVGRTDERLESGLPTHPSVFIPSVPFALAVLVGAADVVNGDFGDSLTWMAAAIVVLIVARQIFALVENISFWRHLESEVRSRTDELKRSEERFRSLIQNSSDVITLVDPRGTILYHSPASEIVFGYENGLLQGSSLLELVHPSDREFVVVATAALAERPAETVSVQCRIRHSDGTWRHVEAVLTNLLHDPAVGAFVINTRDITERKHSEQLTHQAFHDPLTNLANRALFSHQLEEALARRSDDDTSPAILFVDLDDFKDVNDSFGHAAGDAVLAEAADRLLSCMRSTDVVARYGGDEFAIIVEGATGEEELVQLARRLGVALEPSFRVGEQEVRLSASIGIACCPVAGETSSRLLRSADLAMYAAKSDGKNAVRVFETKLGAKLVERVAVHAEAA